MGYYSSLKKKICRHLKRLRKLRSSTVLEETHSIESNPDEFAFGLEESNSPDTKLELRHFDLPTLHSHYEVFQHLQQLRRRQQDPCALVSTKLALSKKIMRSVKREEVEGTVQQGEYEYLAFYTRRLRKRKEIMSRRKIRLATKQLQMALKDDLIC
ncbi:unnamed protein product [Hermetia illucens]|uniref:Uncharacterized protein n=1 Tax=Hermetia illucens TaxID=343691 RepID=A0A7R8UCR8_HERIL|nr:unnamed protein product [Hermetia illucens]